MSGLILALNAGSSSLKFGLFAQAGSAIEPQHVASGAARPGRGSSYGVRIVDRAGRSLTDEPWDGAAIEGIVEKLLGWIEQRSDLGNLVAVGHRVVHGGPDLCQPVPVDRDILARIKELVPLAPLHQPACLRPIELLLDLRPALPQVACFDTAFHRSIAPPASSYALPRQYAAQGIRRYGFHGLSFESIVAQLRKEDGPGVAEERIIIAHLGNGASLCALRNLESVDTTMGFSTLDGLVMGTRPGAIDPGILLYLMRQGGFSADQLEQLLYRECGLLGVSGISSDVVELLASNAPAAREALDLFAFQVARHAGALAATLGGLDRLIFTGGIGENAAPVRSMIVDRLGLFGAQLNQEANLAGDKLISSPASALLIERRQCEEELAIAGHVCALTSVDPTWA